MTDLITRLENASVGDRELDADVWEAAGKCAHRELEYYHVQSDTGFKCKKCRRDPHYGPQKVQPITTSLDAITALIQEKLPGWRWSLYQLNFGPFVGYLKSPLGINEDSKIHGIIQSAPHEKPELALCIAFLKALEARDDL